MKALIENFLWSFWSKTCYEKLWLKAFISFESNFETFSINLTRKSFQNLLAKKKLSSFNGHQKIIFFLLFLSKLIFHRSFQLFRNKYANKESEWTQMNIENRINQNINRNISWNCFPERFFFAFHSRAPCSKARLLYVKRKAKFILLRELSERVREKIRSWVMFFVIWYLIRFVAIRKKLVTIHPRDCQVREIERKGGKITSILQSQTYTIFSSWKLLIGANLEKGGEIGIVKSFE